MPATAALLLALLLPAPPAGGADPAIHPAQIQGNQPALADRQRRMEELRAHHRGRAAERQPYALNGDGGEGGPPGLPGADAGRWDGWYERGAFHGYPYGDGDPYALTYDEEKGTLTIERRDRLPF